jgi:hypothetical protein
MGARTEAEKAKARADKERLKLKKEQLKLKQGQEQNELKETLARTYRELQECRLALQRVHPKSSSHKSSSHKSSSHKSSIHNHKSSTPSVIIKNKRCQKGTRKNKKTGKCEKY